MAISKTSGALAMSEIQTEFGGSNPIDMSEYYGDGGIPSTEDWVFRIQINSTTSGNITLIDYDETIVFSIDPFACSQMGDINNDGGWNVLDVVTLANCVLAGNCDLLDYACAADINSDGGYNILDIVILVNLVLD